MDFVAMTFVYEFVESESDEVYLVQKNSIWLIIIGKSLTGQFEKSYNFMAIFRKFFQTSWYPKNNNN